VLRLTIWWRLDLESCWLIWCGTRGMKLARTCRAKLEREVKSNQKVLVSSKCHGLYRNLLGDEFLVGWFKLVSRFWLVGYPFFVINFSNLQNFVGASHIRSAPPATCPTLVYWCFVMVCRAVWFFYDHLLASSDLHFARPVFWREGRMNLVGPSKNIICFIHFLSAIFLLLEVAGNTN